MKNLQMSIAYSLHGKAKAVDGKATGDKKIRIKAKLRQAIEDVKDEIKENK